MRTIRFFLVFFTLAFAALPTMAGTDYKVDPTFRPGFNDRVNTVFLQPDGKLLVGGKFRLVNGTTNRYIVRLNPDGTRDLTFNSSLDFPSDSERTAGVEQIKPLPNGQFLITGYFRFGSQNTAYARINSDGSFDATMALGYTHGDVEPVPGGKFIACGLRTINGELYEVAYRLNSDGSPDPSFRVTFAPGYCEELKLSSNGKILMTGWFGEGAKSMYRLNLDGSVDPSFVAGIPVDAIRAHGLTETPDGKIFVTSNGVNNLLQQDGSLYMSISQCSGDAFLPLSDGSAFVSDCRKYPGSFQFLVARALPDGTVDQSLDYINIAGSIVAGFRSIGDGTYYLFGEIRGPNGFSQVARLVPVQAAKPTFDFDGDGRSDVAVFRPADGYWYINQSTAGYAFTRWGLAGDKLAAHDFDQDAKTDIAVFRNGDLHVYSSSSGYQAVHMGQAGDKPLVGVFYDLLTSRNMERWIVRGDRSGTTWFVWAGPLTPGPMTLSGELATDTPIVGDFDGDSWDEIGYFRDGYWYSRLAPAPARSIHWGMAGDIPVPADYDGDRQTDYAVFRPSTGDWYVLGSTAGYFAMHWGATGDVPVPADYDGDGKADIAIFRNGEWWQFLSATGTVNFVHWGMTGDLPVQAQMR